MTAALEGGEWSAARLDSSLPPGQTRYPLYRRLGGPQGRSGRAENLVPTGIRFRTVQPVAQSLYRLSYPAHICLDLFSLIYKTTISEQYNTSLRVLRNLHRCSFYQCYSLTGPNVVYISPINVGNHLKTSFCNAAEFLIMYVIVWQG